MLRSSTTSSLSSRKQCQTSKLSSPLTYNKHRFFNLNHQFHRSFSSMSPNYQTSDLVETEWAHDHLSNLRIVDATWHMPSENRSALKEFKARRIPGAQFFDIDHIADTDSTYPHMVPSPERFAQEVGRLGIDENDHVVVYDTFGLRTAARAWFLFKYFGHEKVSVMNGGLPKWIQDSFAMDTNSDVPEPTPKTYHVPQPQKHLLRTFEEVKQNLSEQNETVVDARSADRFHGRAPEPRPGLRTGHIPHSKNVPFPKIVGEDGLVKDKEALEKLFTNVLGAGYKDQHLVASCGSGVTAAVVMLGLQESGAKHLGLYDGSWSEWGARMSEEEENDLVNN
eukprot:gb/GECH01007886.1/.p1 GENE.gb/GECH01007886.1/~~gb/GECH01007886.1/.p1  ORF type:complete len:337 (+),score=78.02 gb/GECH01007886.1/:1-1011(+)